MIRSCLECPLEELWVLALLHRLHFSALGIIACFTSSFPVIETVSDRSLCVLTSLPFQSYENKDQTPFAIYYFFLTLTHNCCFVFSFLCFTKSGSDSDPKTENFVHRSTLALNCNEAFLNFYFIFFRSFSVLLPPFAPDKHSRLGS